MSTMTDYEILGINEDATKDEIKTAYRTLAKKYHPDVNDAPNAAAFFRLIENSYQELITRPEKSTEDTYYEPEPAPAPNTDTSYERKPYRPRHRIQNRIIRGVLFLPLSLIKLACKIIYLLLIGVNTILTHLTGVYFLILGVAAICALIAHMMSGWMILGYVIGFLFPLILIFIGTALSAVFEMMADSIGRLLE